jgi:hypothetical protein
MRTREDGVDYDIAVLVCDNCFLLACTFFLKQLVKFKQKVELLVSLLQMTGLS